MKYSGKYNVAVVGATGSTGRGTISMLEERGFPVENLVAIASEKSIGQQVSFKNKTIKVQHFEEVDFSNIQLAFFCAGDAFSKKNAEYVTSRGCVVIDKSSFFRLNPKVPLIVPEVNLKTLHKGAPIGIVSTPNCVVTPLALVLKALSEIAPIKRAVVSTYQSVSGAGTKAIDELYEQTKGIISAQQPKAEIFQKQIAYNVIPAIGDIGADGFSDEEEKISFELCKILKSDIKVVATCVRVPVFIGHSAAVACEFSKAIPENVARESLENFNGVVVVDRREDGGNFITPIEASGEDAVYVSRIRTDPSVKHGLMFWISCDNLRKGASLNSVQIAEEMIAKDPKLKIFKKK